jgi:hypothetical protein
VALCVLGMGALVWACGGTDGIGGGSGGDGAVADEGGTGANDGASPADATVAPGKDGSASSDGGGGTTDAAKDGAGDGGGAGQDAAIGCILGIFGNHYIRSDGHVLWANPGTQTEVTVSGGGALSGVVEGIESQWHACARKSDNTVWCWATSANQFPGGELGDGNVATWPAQNFVATQVLAASVSGGAPAPITNATALMTDSYNMYDRPTCVVRADKTAWCWGYVVSSFGSPKLITGAPSNAPVAVAYPIVTGATLADGGPANLTGVEEISAGGRHICAIASVNKSRDTVYCWGNNTGNELGDTLAGDTAVDRPFPVALTRLPAGAVFSHIGASLDDTCVQANDKLICWGENDYGQAGTGVPITIQPGCIHYCENRDPAPPVLMGAPDAGAASGTVLTNISRPYVGYQFSCVLAQSGAPLCFGDLTGGGGPFAAMAVPYAPVGQPAVPSVARITSRGPSGFPTALRYVTPDGSYYQGGIKITPTCN